MTYSKREFAKDFKAQIDRGYNPQRIGSWAHHTYFHLLGELNEELEEVLEGLMVLEAGPEFELPFEEISALVNKLTEEGEKEDIGTPDLNIKDLAEDLGSHWLMCPLCEESWENYIEYAMVRCPKCNQKLHNPQSKNALQWTAESNFLKLWRYEIKYLPVLGYYLYAFENEIRLYTNFQDTWENILECAWEDFNVPKDLWKRDE